MVDNRKLVFESKLSACTKCHGELQYMGHGQYRCTTCGNVELDDFGKVYKYIDENGPAPAIIIAQGTGVHIEKINNFLREGRVEIPEGSDVYIKCERCGRDIRFGRFCPECAASLSKQLQGVFEAGEVPKSKSGGGKMRFINKFNDKY